MAAAGGGMAVLPQYQGDYYQLQRQQALANALMQSSMTPQNTQAVGSGQYQIVPKYSIGGGLAQLGQALLAAKYSDNVSQGMRALGQQQWAAFGGTPSQQGTVDAQQQSTPNPFNGTQGAPVAGDANTGAMSGVSAGMGAAAPQSAPAPQQQVTQGYGGANATAMNPLGMPAALAYSAYQSDQGKYFETQSAAFKPAEIVSQIRAAGIDPNSALGHQIAQNSLAKANYIAPVSTRPGGALMDSGGNMHYTLPAPQAGAMWATNQDGSLMLNQAGQPYQIGIGGAADAARGMAAAEAGGKAQYHVMPGMQGGKPVYTTAYNLSNGLPPPGGANSAGGVNAGSFSGYQAPGGSPVTPGLAPGADKIAGGSADSFNSLRSAAGSTTTAIDGYNKAEESLLSGVTTGPGSTVGANIIGRLNTAGIPILKGDVTGYQSLQKYLSNANAQAASASGYNGSDARFEAFSHGQPNTETMNPTALRYAIQYVRGQQAGVQAKYQAAQSFINQQGGGTGNYPQFEAQWNRVYSPDVMMVRAMPNPADQQKYLQTLKQQGKLNDWMNSYRQMQAMGAF